MNSVFLRHNEELVPFQKLRQKKKGHLAEAAPDIYDSSGSDFHPKETEDHSDDSCSKVEPIGGKIRCSLSASQRDLFIKSLQSHRNHEPTDDEKRALDSWIVLLCETWGDKKGCHCYNQKSRD